MKPINKIFNYVNPNPMVVLVVAKTKFLEFMQISKDSNQVAHFRPHVTNASIWRPIRATFLKVNADATFIKETGKGSIGVVCRDDKGRALTMMAARIFASSPLVAIAWNLQEALVVGQNLHLQKVNFKSDNLQLIEVCRGNTELRKIQGIIKLWIYLNK